MTVHCWGGMRSDHDPVEADFAVDVPVEYVDQMVSREAPPRFKKGEDNVKFHEMMRDVAAAIRLVPSTHVRRGEVDPIMDVQEAAINKHRKPRGRRPRPAAQTEIRRLRSWALVTEALEHAKRRGLRQEANVLARPGGPLQPLYNWLPIVKGSTMSWGEITTLLRGWADRMSADIAAFDKRTRSAEFFRKHMDSAWHWAGIAVRLGRPSPRAMDKVVVVEEHSLEAIQAPEIGFMNMPNGASASFKLRGDALIFGIGTPVVLAKQVNLSGSGSFCLPDLGLKFQIRPEDCDRVLPQLRYLCALAGISEQTDPSAEAPNEGLLFADAGSGVTVRCRVEQGQLGIVRFPPEVVVKKVIANADGSISLPDTGHQLQIPPSDRFTLLPVLRHLCAAGGADLEMPKCIQVRRTVTDPVKVKEEFEKWAAETQKEAFQPNAQGKPSSLDEARGLYRSWLERADMPVADDALRASAKDVLLRPLERAEFDRHINKRAGMAAGLDGCSWEILQHLPDDCKDRLFTTLRNFFRLGYSEEERVWKHFPNWFGRAWTSPIPKSGFDHTTNRRAFDLCEPRLATEYLDRIGVPHALSAYLLAQLEGTSKVWTAHGWTREVDVKRGTRQGGVESPLLFLLLVDPILHVLNKELQSSFVKRKLLGKAGPWQGRDCNTGEVFRFRVDDDGDLLCSRESVGEFVVEKVSWEGRALSCAGAGQLSINDAVILELPLDSVVGMGRLRGLCENLGTGHNIEQTVWCRGPNLSSRPGFLGAYADDLLIGHADPVFLQAIMKQMKEFYSVIGCEINLSKSYWMVVHGQKDGADRPTDTA
eukprot:gene57395-biopygen88786